MKKALCLFAIGKKYEDILSKNLEQFSRYAKKCGAELVIIREPLDKTEHRTILEQKMLIPTSLPEYDIIVFIDLDVIISKDCPSLFDLIPNEKAVAAVLAPRGTEKYRNFYRNNASVLEETSLSYFERKNFSLVEGLLGDINGGVLVFKPKIIGDLFKDYYYSNHSQGKSSAYEEAPIAYYAQSKNIFFPLPEAFNREFFYDFYTPRGNKIGKIKSNCLYKIINNLLKKLFKCEHDSLLMRKQKALKKELLQETYILHFSGKTSSKLYTEDLDL